MRTVIAFLIGLLFGLGIVVSGMVNPAKVINFFDFFGTWDPSLAFVMGGALLTTFAGYRAVLRRHAPFLDTKFSLPTATRIDWKLILGSGVFGVGWGISGFCPGGAVPAAGTAQIEALVFMTGLVSGLVITRFILARAPKTPSPGATVGQEV